MERALRRCLVAVYFGEALGLDADDLRTAYYLALLQYVGCTADAQEMASIYGDEVAAGEWFVRVGSGQPREVLVALVRNLGAMEPLLRRAATVATAFADLP